MPTRLIARLSPLGLALIVGAACGGRSDGPDPTSIGAPCAPTLEQDPLFGGFDVREVNLEQGAKECSTGLCLIHHFRGRVSCPFGQDRSGAAPSGASACKTPVTLQPVAPNSAVTGNTVQPQCTDRTASQTIYCSCRCANNAGRTDDGASYCDCPGGFTCASIVSGIGGPPAPDISGSYCIKNGTVFDGTNACAVSCDPVVSPCP